MADVQLSALSLSVAPRPPTARPASAAEPPVFGRLLQAALGGGAKTAPQDVSGLMTTSPEAPAQTLPEPGLAVASVDAPGKDAGAAKGSGKAAAQDDLPVELAGPVSLPLNPAATNGILKRQVAPEAVAAKDGAVAAKDGAEAAATLAAGRQTLPAGLPAGLPNGSATGSEIILAAASLPGPEQKGVGESASPEAMLRGLPLPPAERPVLAAGRETLPLHLPIRTPGWDGELGQRIVWMAGRQAQWAEMTLNPPNLGSLEVRLSINGTEAGVHFFAAQQSVREAIEAALPRLREMLAEAGLSLGQTQVSAESFGGRSTGDEAHGDTNEAEQQAGLPHEMGGMPIHRAVLGLVDLYV